MEDVYEKLRQHFNEGVISKLRKARELEEILKILFTPEKAELALHIPLRGMERISIEDLAAKLNRKNQEIEEAVEEMAREGILYAVQDKEDGKKYCALFALLPGILESYHADGVDSDLRRRLDKLIDKYRVGGLWDEMASSDYPPFRVIPINENAENKSEVLPFEEIRNTIMEADIITVIPCMCRTISRKCDHLLEVDFVMGDWAEYLINYRGAREWTKEEALQRLKEAEEDGLMHLIGNAQEGNTIICNCCVCCCMALRGLTELNNPRSFVKSNFLPVMDQELCTLCGTCKKICPMEAVRKLPGYEADGSDTRMMVEETRCVGCGLCSSHCPVEAIHMKKIRDVVPAKTPVEMVERWVEQRVI